MKVGLDLLGKLLVALGLIAWSIGAMYGIPETIAVLDPMIETTQDLWLLFMQTNGATVAQSGLGMLLVGAIIVWYANGAKLPRLRKKNRFTCCKWHRRVLA